MSKGSKRQRNYDEEIEDAIKRFKKYSDSRTAAKHSDTWLDFLDDMGINPKAIDKGGEFWENVRQGVKPESREPDRRKKYDYLRDMGVTPKEARQQRDWSWERIQNNYSASGYMPVRQQRNN